MTTDVEALGRMVAVEHLALTTLNMMIHWRATSFGADPVDEAHVIADGLIATFLDSAFPVDVRTAAIAALRAEGRSLIDAAERLASARATDGG